MDRDTALDHVDAVADAVKSETLPAPVCEAQAHGDVVPGLDPPDRLDVYVTKGILPCDDPDAAESFEWPHGAKDVDKSAHAEQAREHPDLLRANANDYAIPEKRLTAHLLPDEEPIHPEACNVLFEDNVTQRLKGAVKREVYEQILDPCGVRLYTDGQHSSDTASKLRNGESALPALPGTLEMLGLEDDDTKTAVEAMRTHRAERTGTPVCGDVV